MKQLEVIEFPGQDYILNNLDFFKNKFVEESVLVFRNANLSYEEHFDFHIKLGKEFGWYSAGNEEDRHYIENHSKNPEIGNAGPDDILVFWHIEHVYLPNPISVATWNMYKFDADENTGKTYFIDTSKLYEELSEDWQNFLQKCTAKSENIGQSERDKDDPEMKKSEEYTVVKDHWITNKKVIRIHFNRNEDRLNKLGKFDGRAPSKEEEEKFFEISKYINKKVTIDMENLMFHKWKKGDLVIPDLFKLAHAVTGGFDPKDREFCGKWGVQFKE